MLEHLERGSWLLVHVLEKGHGRDTEPTRAEKWGYIVFKDQKVVTFYTNNLADIPQQEIEGRNEHALSCVSGEATGAGTRQR